MQVKNRISKTHISEFSRLSLYGSRVEHCPAERNTYVDGQSVSLMLDWLHLFQQQHTLKIPTINLDTEFNTEQSQILQIPNTIRYDSRV